MILVVYADNQIVRLNRTGWSASLLPTDSPESANLVSMFQRLLTKMRRVWVLMISILSLFLLICSAYYRHKIKTQLPPPLEVADCFTPAPRDELPMDEFIRKGGRITQYVGVRREGSALTFDNVAQGRDLHDYDRLELADHGVLDRQFQMTVMVQAREFLWKHWQEKKKAYLILTYHSVDATSTSHIFLERDNTGRWRIYSRLISHHAVYDSPTMYSMRWVIPSKEDEPDMPLPQGQPYDPVKHRLEMMDVCGK